jgi:hypothetical protein
MNQTKLGDKWKTKEEDLGGIHRYMQRVAGTIPGKEITMAKKDEILVTAAGDTFDMDSIVEEIKSEASPNGQETQMDPDAAKMSIMGLLSYVPSLYNIDPVFNLMADIMKLPVPQRKMEQDDKVTWMASNLGKLDAAGASAVYKAISSLK